MDRILPRDVLRGSPTVTTSDVDDAHAKIAELFCRHRLMPQTPGRSLAMKLRSLHRGDVGIDFLDYGAEVRIDPEGLENFLLVQVPLAGRARMKVGSNIVESSPRVATIPPMDRPFSMVWDLGAPHLIVYVSRPALAAVAEKLYAHDATDDVDPGYSMDLVSAPGRAFLRSVIELHDDMITGAPQASHYVHRLLVDTMLSRLLMATDKSPATAGIGTPVVERSLIRRFRELLERHASEELAVTDLAEHLGVSMRTLQTALRSEFGATPSELLRKARLNRARELLLGADPGDETVIAIAARCGFSHPGRFSSSYLTAFGELPSESLRR
ncbi:AraC-like DNA-binding protein [Arthrobacter pascens]|uniref:AraC family transcriptional regulator n=1 Tax=Arthrobacter pascens TaxID=1677 RepID=UPI002792A0A9|nr:AraC family transcriptional regulator [Arthrobacter pascens]MDQ0678916.1 AraC-like DNA-binding protein [Arthrobacter pascens]